MKPFNLNYITFCILASIGFALAGCGRKPEDTVEKYLDYTFLNNNGKKAYKLLSSDDKKYKSEKEFSREVKRKNIFNNKYLKKYKNQFNYEILETKYSGDTALVKVALTKPNTQNILHEIITFTMSTSFSMMNEKERSAVIQEQFRKEKKIETETEEREFILIKENGTYKIYLNLGYAHKEILGDQVKRLESEVFS